MAGVIGTISMPCAASPFFQPREFGLVTAALGQFDVGQHRDAPDGQSVQTLSRAQMPPREPYQHTRIDEHADQSFAAEFSLNRSARMPRM
jgi:hypothetical protein